MARAAGGRQAGPKRLSWPPLLSDVGGCLLAYETISYETDGRVASIVLNRPERMNAMNTKMLAELSDALERAEEDGEVIAVVVRGAGSKAFSSGADISEMQAGTPWTMRRYNMVWIDLFHQIEMLRKPVIAVVEGYALAGGFELALSCDLVVATDNARFGLAEINIGVIPGAGGPQRLTRLMSRNKAKEILMTGDMISAADAQALGLVNRLTTAEGLEEELQQLLDTICSKSPLALAAVKAAVNVGGEMEMDTGILHTLNEYLMLFGTEDQEEGMKAFFEKRKPVFKGR